MISLSVDSRYIADLEDDFVMNEDLTLYEFIGNDPVKAFYLGYKITKWFEYLDKSQKYLYSKEARHNRDSLEKYQEQINFWTSKYKSSGEVDLICLSEYIINNMFYDEETEDLDRVKLAFFFGDIIASKEKELSSVKPILQIDSKGNIVKEWESIDEIISNLGCNKSAILKCLKGSQNFHKGFRWRYRDE